MITVYSKDNCVQCKMLLQRLDKEKIPHRIIKVDVNNIPLLNSLKKSGVSQFPAVFKNDRLIFTGFRVNKISQLKG